MSSKPTRVLGRTGVRVSPLTLGTMNFGRWREEDESIRIIRAALDAGITAVDTADVYAQGVSEEIVGRERAGALNGFPLHLDDDLPPARAYREAIDFATLVVPIRQERGLFQKDFGEPTLRGRLGLEFPTREKVTA